MRNKLFNILRNFCSRSVLIAIGSAGCLTGSAVLAGDYTVLGGTFFMKTGPGPDATDVVPSPIPINPGANTVFNDDAPGFLGNWTCPALCLSPFPRGFIEPDATVSGLTTFPFQGQSVYTYFASNGADSCVDPGSNACATIVDPNHPPPSITLDPDELSGTADLSSWYANWNGIEFNQGSSSAVVTSNFDGSFTISWQSIISGDPFDGFLGIWTWKVQCNDCAPVDPGPAPRLEIVQNAITTHTTAKDVASGLISVDIISSDATFPTGYDINLSETDDAIDGGLIRGQCASCAGSGPPPYNFGLNAGAGTPPGSYEIVATIINNNVNPPQATRARTIVTVVDTGNLVDLGDDDNDGVQNINDGIDNTVTPTLLQTQQGNSNSFIMESSDGEIVVGQVALCAGTSSAGVSIADVLAFGGGACTASGPDSLGQTVFGVGGIFDFEIQNIGQGSTVDVVIPLSSPLPKNASYRKYSVKNTQWDAFDTSGNDALASSPANSTGVCPGPSNAGWSSGFTEGHECIRLSITDGGPNDSDGLADGVIKDPGGVSSTPDTDSSRLDLGGCSVTGKPEPLTAHMEWLILTGFIFWLGVLRRKTTH